MDEDSRERRRRLRFSLRVFLISVMLTVISGCLPPDSPPDLNSLNALCFSPDGSMLAVGGYKQVDLWDATTGKPIRSFEEHLSEVYSVAFSPDGRYVASSGRDKKVRVLNRTTGQVVAVLPSGQSVVSVVFSQDSRTLVSADLSGRAIFWETDDWQEKWRITRGHHIPRAALSPDGKMLALVVWNYGGRDAIELWDMETRTIIRELSEDGFSLSEITFSPSGDSLAAMGLFDRVAVWNVTTGRKKLEFQAARSSHSTIAFSPDGKLLATGGHDGKIRLWSADSGEQVATLEGHAFEVECLAFSPNQMQLASAVGFKKDGRHHAQVFMWDVIKKEILFRMAPVDETADANRTSSRSESPPDARTHDGDDVPD